MYKTINVTQQHIDSGTCRNMKNCPISKALKDVGIKHTLVDEDFITISNTPIPLVYKEDNDSNKIIQTLVTPTSVAAFLDKYDRHERVFPFKFRLNLRKDLFGNLK